MKNIKTKTILLVIIAFMLFLTGCKVDKTYTIDRYELKEDTYVLNVPNEQLSEDLIDGITLGSKQTIDFYSDEEHNNKLDSTIVSLEDGDNLYYAVITFGDKSTEDLKFNLYHLRMFTVKFETNCGTKIKDQHVEEGSLITKPTEKLKKYGYGFKGWNYNLNAPVTKDLVLEARWVPNSFNVIYDAKGGELTENEVFVTYGEPYQLATPTKKGYDFVGWSYEGKLIKGEVWNLDGDITIEAVWEEETITYEIDYVIVGCVGAHLQRTYTNKEEVVLRTPYKCGYRFRGWYRNNDYSDDRVYVIPKGTTGNQKFYSRWERFELEGAKISILGDSISTFYQEGSHTNSLYNGKDEYFFPIYSKEVKTVEQTWWYQTIEATRTKLVANDSLSGSTCYNNGSENCTPQATMNNFRIDHIKNSDIVLVFIGTNDLVNGYSEVHFRNAYDTMLKRIKKACPDCYVFCCTLGYSATTYGSYTDSRRIKFNEIITDVTTNNDYETIRIDQIQTKDNYKELLGDSLHPNLKGMKVIADKAIETIKNYVDARF